MMGISITGGVKVPQGKFSVGLAAPAPVAGPQLWSWGSNGAGGLGHGDTANRSSPVQVGALVDWSSVIRSRAIKTDGTLWSWGLNSDGQLGQGDTVSRSSPVQVGASSDWAIVEMGNKLNFAIKTDGNLWSWGYNRFGVLGLNDVIYRSSPVQVGALSDWASISAGTIWTVATKTDGTLWTWGLSNGGRLGNGTGSGNDLSSPSQVGALSDWASISAGGSHSLAIKINGTLWAWGRGFEGALGNGIAGISTDRSSPVQIGALSDWAGVSAASVHSLAVKTDGTLWSWGKNTYGQLGQNDLTDRSSPVQIGALSNWASDSAGSSHSMARKIDGSLWAWGRNNRGQLGQNDLTDRSSPVQIGALTDWTNLNARGSTVFAIKTG